MAVNFKQATMRNFMSYGNDVTTVDLSFEGTTLILGENHDSLSNELGITRNGAGKTTIINAIAYALYGRPLSKISMDNLVNDINEKDMEVTVSFTVDDVLYKVVRKRKKRGSSTTSVELWVDGKDKTPDSIAATEREVERILRMPYELFVRIVVVSAAHTPFLDMPVRHASQPNQSDFMEELFSITDISAKAELLKSQISDTEKRLAFKKQEIELLEQEHARYKSLVDHTKRRVLTWESDIAQQVADLEVAIKKANVVDIDGQKTLIAEVASLDQTITSLRTRMRAITSDISSNTLKKETLLGELEHLKDSKCPYCLQDFAGTADKIAATESKIAEINSNVDLLNEEVATLTDERATVEEARDAKQRLITVDDIDSLIELRAESSKMLDRLDSLKSAVNPHIETLDELVNNPPKAISYDDVNALTDDIEHQKFLQKLLTKKDSFIRKALLDKNLPFLNGRMQHYLSGMGLPHKVEFTPEMTAAITRMGRPLDFGNLSAGQRARVNLALSLSFRDVLQHMHQKINICMLDEVLDISLDEVGVQSATNLLKLVAREQKLAVYVISHKSEISHMFDRYITVQLKNGFSTIKNSGASVDA